MNKIVKQETIKRDRLEVLRDKVIKAANNFDNSIEKLQKYLNKTIDN